MDRMTLERQRPATELARQLIDCGGVALAAAPQERATASSIDSTSTGSPLETDSTSARSESPTRTHLPRPWR